MPQKVEFFVPGLPAPGGSKKAFVNKKTGRANIVDAGGQKTMNWRANVANRARIAFSGPLLDCPVQLKISFTMPRPQHHYRTGRYKHLLKDSAPIWHTSKPDTLKLTRSTEDAMTHIVWRDDAQVVYQTATKIYGDEVGAKIEITPLFEHSAADKRKAGE